MKCYQRLILKGIYHSTICNREKNGNDVNRQ